MKLQTRKGRQPTDRSRQTTYRARQQEWRQRPDERLGEAWYQQFICIFFILISHLFVGVYRNHLILNWTEWQRVNTREVPSFCCCVLSARLVLECQLNWNNWLINWLNLICWNWNWKNTTKNTILFFSSFLLESAALWREIYLFIFLAVKRAASRDCLWGVHTPQQLWDRHI